MKRKICRECRIFYDDDKCPICKGTQVSTSFKGRVMVVSPDKSMIAKKVGLPIEGEYAIKVS